MSGGTYQIEEMYGLFRVQEHQALNVNEAVFEYTGNYNLSALKCIHTASNKNDLRTYLETNKKKYHHDRFVVMPIFDVNFVIGWDDKI